MKIKHFLFGGILTLTTALGAFVGVNSFDKQAKQVQEVSAGNSHNIYFATTTSRNNYYADAKYNDKSGSEDWRGSHNFSLVGRSGSYYIYCASVYEEYGGLNGLWIRYGSGGTGGEWVDTAIDWNVWTVYSTYENKVFVHGSSANDWKSIYTITYNPNGGTGSTKTDYKIQGVNYSILTYANAGIGAAGGRHAVKWGTNSTGTGTSYQPGATYSTNANLSLHFIQDWYTYQFRINSGSWQTLTRKESSPEGYVAEFESASTSFTSGDTISFQRYYGSGSASSVSPSAWENNVSSSGVIYYSFDGKIYVKVTNGDGHTIYAEGFSERGVVIVRGGTEYKVGCSKDSGTQWHVDNITLLPGDTLKGTYNGGDSYTIYVENTDVYGISSAGAVSTPGVYTIYLKSTDGGYNFPNVYLGMNDDASAKLIAQTFNAALTTVCNSTVGGGATSQITSAFSTQKNYYDHLTSTCQTAVKTSSTDVDVVAMRAKYDYIVGKYGITIAPDYMKRNPAPIGRSTFSPIVLLADNNNSTVVIIIVSTLVAVSAVGGYFLLRKRKEQ